MESGLCVSDLLEMLAKAEQDARVYDANGDRIIGLRAEWDSDFPFQRVTFQVEAK